MVYDRTLGGKPPTMGTDRMLDTSPWEEILVLTDRYELMYPVLLTKSLAKTRWQGQERLTKGYI